MTDQRDIQDDGLSPVPLPEQPPMNDAAGGPQADDADEADKADKADKDAPDDPAAPHTPVTD